MKPDIDRVKPDICNEYLAQNLRELGLSESQVNDLAIINFDTIGFIIYPDCIVTMENQVTKDAKPAEGKECGHHHFVLKSLANRYPQYGPCDFPQMYQEKFSFSSSEVYERTEEMGIIIFLSNGPNAGLLSIPENGDLSLFQKVACNVLIAQWKRKEVAELDIGSFHGCKYWTLEDFEAATSILPKREPKRSK